MGSEISKWFASYLTNRNQFLSISKFNSDLADTASGFYIGPWNWICGTVGPSLAASLEPLAC